MPLARCKLLQNVSFFSLFDTQVSVVVAKVLLDMKLSFRNRELTSFDATAIAIEAQGLSSNRGLANNPAVQVVQLDLAHNALHAFIGGRSLPHLSEFIVSHNLLRTLQNFPVNIVRLDVSHNKLEALHGVEHFGRLVHLDCSHNFISEIVPDALPASLQTLVLSHNHIHDAIGLCHLHKLLKVSLDHNSIATVAGVVCLGGLKSLRHITIQGNPVCASPKLLPALTASIPKLTTLDGLVLSQAQANQIFRVAQVSAEKQKAARQLEQMQQAAVRRSFVRKEAEDEAAENEVRRLEARAKELERLAAIAVQEESKLKRQNQLLHKQLDNVAGVLESQNQQLTVTRHEIEKQSQFAETLRRTLASLDRTFKQQHASIIAKRLERTSSSTRKTPR